MSDKRAIEFAIRNRFGMDVESKIMLSEFNEKQTDWYTTCPKCKAQLRGTLAQIREHSCGDQSKH